MPVINLINPDNKFGNTVDLRLVKDILEPAGFEVHSTGTPHYGLKRRWFMVGTGVLKNLGRFDLNLFLGPVFKEWFPFAKRHAIMPNVEWYRPEWVPLLKHFTLVFAKTRHTERIFKKHGCATEFVSFTSNDCFDPGTPKSYESFFHSSSNHTKGTARLLSVWERHPEWPTLTAIVNRSSVPPTTQAENIDLRTTFVSSEEYRALQNRSGVHVCPSEAEGWGHSIVEAMTTRAVTMTTNGPPMNEAIRPDRGRLLDPAEEGERGLSTFYRFSAESLEKTMDELNGMGEVEKAAMGARARAWFEEQDRFFRENLPGAVESALKR